MNGFGFLFALLTAGLLVRLPRRWAPLPLIMGAAYVSLSQQIGIGPLHFPLIRILIAVGFLRVISKKERIVGGWTTLDQLMFLWALWAVASAVFHKSGVLVYRLGVVFDSLGAYFLFRVFLQGLDDVRYVFRMACMVLVPLAFSMIAERLTGKNPLAVVGFGPAEPELRSGYYRAQGAFAHPILAGTVGAVCLPMALSLWRHNRNLACAGLAAAIGILFSSGSSGPLMAAFSVLGAVVLWRIRSHLRAVRWAVVFLLLAVNAAMNAPVYYLVQRIDITGGSQGWYRARLIESSAEHLNEWWLTGTDRTRHWMPSGLAANPDHTDMTNYYLQMGVWGGLPLIVLFVGVLSAAFVRVGQALRLNESAPIEEQFLIWTLGCILLGHAVAFLSISYFDQTFVFLELAVASIGSIQTWERASPSFHAQAVDSPSPENDPHCCPVP